MRYTISLLLIIALTTLGLNGQVSQLISTTTDPLIGKYPNNNNPKIVAIYIYEQFTVISVRFTAISNYQTFRISSKSFILDTYDVNNRFAILGIQDNELDKVYSLGSKGNVTQMNIAFERITPGIEKINLTLNADGTDQYRWEGITIKNPNNHPKTYWKEQSLMGFWEKNGLSDLEGIYENTKGTDRSTKYKLALKKEADGYCLIYLEGALFQTWRPGEIKAYLSETSTPLLFKAKWFMFNKGPNENCYITFEPGIMKVMFTGSSQSSGEELYIKLYPKADYGDSRKGALGSGTGFALDSEGLIVTNNHVIEGCKKISIWGINGIFDKPYNAKILIADKNNDLALIRIDDPSFSGLGNIPFIIRPSTASTGESVFVLGYPLRASMGDEIKLTNGIVSSRTGFQGDITQYQISAPVQPGNSGGPLFDKDGNLIGIINAKHGEAENVSYAIKAIYLKNLIEQLDIPPTFPMTNKLTGKSLTQQVEAVKKFVYIIEVQ